MQIVSVKASDAKKLLEIYAPYVEKTAISFEYTPPSVREFRKRIKNIVKKYPYIMAIEGEKVLGYAYAVRFKQRKAYDFSVETTVYVREDARNSGIGRALYNELERRLADLKIVNMVACVVYTSEESEYLTDASVKFHEKMGFERAAHFRHIGFKFGRWFDMLWLQKTIEQNI